MLEADPDAARHLARRYASIYLDLPNYTNNLRTFGFGDDDIGGGGSDRLIDAVIPWGDAAAVAARVREHLEAGADHVCIQVVADHHDFPLAAVPGARRRPWRRRPARSRRRRGLQSRGRALRQSLRQGAEGAAPVRQGILLHCVHLRERAPVAALPGAGTKTGS